MNMRNFGTRMEKYLIDLTTTEKKFEYEIAVLEDENEEKLEALTKNLDDEKLALRCSTHHLKLDENLEKCFACVDQIDTEFREFHERNTKVVKQHAPLIEDMFDILENDFANLMELRSLDKKAELEERAEKITRWKAKLAADLQVKLDAERLEKELADLLAQNVDNKKFKPPKAKAKNEKQLQ